MRTSVIESMKVLRTLLDVELQHLGDQEPGAIEVRCLASYAAAAGDLLTALSRLVVVDPH